MIKRIFRRQAGKSFARRRKFLLRYIRSAYVGTKSLDLENDHQLAIALSVAYRRYEKHKRLSLYFILAATPLFLSVIAIAIGPVRAYLRGIELLSDESELSGWKYAFYGSASIIGCWLCMARQVLIQTYPTKYAWLRRHRLVNVESIGICIGLIGYATIQLADLRDTSHIYHFHRGLLSVGLTVAFVSLVAIFTLYPLGGLVRYGMIKHIPDIQSADRLLEALRILEVPGAWRNARRRSAAIPLLEDAARTIELGLPRLFVGAGLFVNDWIGDRARLMADGIRELEMAVITPREGSREYSLKVLKCMISALVKGRLDEMPGPTLPTRSMLSRKKRILGVVRLLVIAAIPLAGATFLKSMTSSIDQALMNGAYVVGIAWFVGHLLHLFDPTLSSRIAAIRPTWDMILPWAKKE